MAEISTSKIKNSNATRKNWKEKGMWDGVIKLNPHSNWVHLFFLVFNFFCAICVAFMKIIEIKIEVTHIIVIFILFFFFYWKLIVLYIL